MVMAQSLFKLIKQNMPQVAIDVLAPAWSEPLLTRMPEVRAALNMPVGHGKLHLRERYRLGRSLRGKYDQAIILPNSFKSALIPFWANIPVRTGYLGECRWGLLNDARRLNKVFLPMTVQRFLALGLPRTASPPPEIPAPRLAISATSVEAALARLDLNYPLKPVLALCPGAEFGPAKRWPAEHFAEIAKTKLAEGWVVWLFGSEKDEPITATVRDLAGAECIDLAGRTSLAEAIDLLSLATLVVSNDSGLMHVAAALARKVIAIYGSSDPSFTPPLSGEAHILSLNLSCSPCFQRVCPLGHTNCLRELLPQQVLNKMPDKISETTGQR